MNYIFDFNNNQSRHTFSADVVALKEAKKELGMLHRMDNNTFKVYVWELLPNGKYRKVGFWKTLK